MLIVDTLPFYGLVFNPLATVENVRPQAEAIREQMMKLPDDQFAAGAGLAASGMVKRSRRAKAGEGEFHCQRPGGVPERNV